MAGRAAGKAKQQQERPARSRQLAPISLPIAFLLFLTPHLLATFLSPIQDCDEVFNYWEPTHYLSHGSGFQTWEYSPVYSIRSWAYAGLHSALILPAQLAATFLGSKVWEFYFLRAVLAVVCAACETRLFRSISYALGPRVALYFLIAMAPSSGMFHAATAYLPSSFAMYTAMLGAAAFMDRSGKLQTARGVEWFAAGALLGWPFAAALVAPYVALEAVLSLFGGNLFDFAARLVDGAVRSVGILAVQTGIDSFFYQKLVCVPWNIVAYNVFSGTSKGPNIYGTEPWHFYTRNLILNFGIWLVLALLAIPLIGIQYLLGKNSASHTTLLQIATYSTPFYLWFTIFTLQPHKEERFMYPAYPLLALNGALSLHTLLALLGHVPRPKLLSPHVLVALAASAVAASTAFSLLRTANLAAGYAAPLRVYAPLARLARPGDAVCAGKEWHRFPSSFFLPHGVRARFVRSEFRGLLPGAFGDEAAAAAAGRVRGGWRWRPATSLVPEGMNDENREDEGKYIDVEQCAFLVDSRLPSAPPTRLEPDYAADETNWEKVVCESFLDAGATGMLARIVWFPEWGFLPANLRRKWGEYCLLRRKI